jgi:hypothetical protein
MLSSSFYELLFVKTRPPQLQLHTLHSVPRDEQMDIDDDLEDCFRESLKPWHFPRYEVLMKITKTQVVSMLAEMCNVLALNQGTEYICIPFMHF